MIASGPTALFVRSELVRHRRGWATVLVLAAVGIAVTVSAAAGARRTLTSFERFRDVSNEPHALLASEGNGPSPVSIEQIEAIDGVDVASEASVFILGLADRDLVPGLHMVVIAAGDGRTFDDVYVPRVIEGRMPSPDRADEISINEGLQRDHDLNVGDRVVVNGPSAEQFQQIIETGAEVDEYDGPSVEATIVGITRTTSNLEDMTFQTYEALAPVAFTKAVDDRAAIGARLTAVRLTDGDPAVPAFLEAVDPLLADDGPQFDANYLSGTDGINGAIRVQAIGLALFSLVALLATLVAVGQAVARQRALAAQGARVLGVLGLRRSETLVALLTPSILVVVAAAGVAAVAAIVASAAFPFGIARLAEPSPGVRFDPLVHLAGPATVALLLVLAELVAAARTVRLASPEPTAPVAPAVRAVRAAPRTATIANVARSLPPAEIGLRLALARTGRRQTARSGVAATVFAVATIASIAIVATTLTFVSNDQRAAGFPWDYKIALGPEGEVTDDALALVEDKAERLTIASEGYTTVNGRPSFVMGLQDVKGSSDLSLFSGRPPRAPDEIVVGRKAADDLDVRVGDTVAVDGETFTLVGIGIVPIVNTDQRHAGAVVTTAGFERVEPAEGEADGRTMLIAWAPDTDVAATTDEIGATQLFGEDPFRPTDLDNLQQIGVIPQALILFLALVGLAAMGHALVSVARWRRRDLATLRALGLTGADVKWAIAWQSWAMAALSIVVGLPAGLVIGRAAWQALADSLGTVASSQLPSSIFGLVPAAGVAASLVAIPVAWHTAKNSAATALRTE